MIKIITLKDLADMLKNPDANYKYSPRGKYICKQANIFQYIACDNTSGDALIEFMPTEDEAIKWLEITV